jgi:hypothetical protein
MFDLGESRTVRKDRDDAACPPANATSTTIRPGKTVGSPSTTTSDHFADTTTEKSIPA